MEGSLYMTLIETAMVSI